MFQLDLGLVCPVRALRPVRTLPNRFRELLALRCGLRVTNYLVGKSLSSWPAVRWLQAATPYTFVAASCYCFGTKVCAITMGVFAISLGVFTIILGVFTSRTHFILWSKLELMTSKYPTRSRLQCAFQLDFNPKRKEITYSFYPSNWTFKSSWKFFDFEKLYI